MNTEYKKLRLSMIPAFVFLFVLITGRSVYAMDDYEQCLVEALRSAGAETTVGELKQSCTKQAAQSTLTNDPGEAEVVHDSAIIRRARLEQQTQDNPFVLTPHKPNYVLFAGYNSSPNESPFRTQFPAENIELDNVEVKFQISAKYPLLNNLFDGKGNLYFAYTNRSFWQAYNNLSAPFRESNHEPELWFSLKNGWKILGLNNTLNQIGLSHQSNGRGGTLSRSWNRLYANFIFEKKNLYFSIKPWIVLAESDDNPDIEDFMGNLEFQSVYKWRQHSISFLLRNNLKTGNNRGAIQADWSFPLYRRLRGYAQVFHGYGESLIDYNASNNTIGIGLQLTDWL